MMGQSPNKTVQYVIDGIMREAIEASVREAQEKVRLRILEAVSIWTAKATSEAHMEWNGSEITLHIKMDHKLLDTRDKQAVMKAIFG